MWAANREILLALPATGALADPLNTAPEVAGVVAVAKLSRLPAWGCGVLPADAGIAELVGVAVVREFAGASVHIISGISCIQLRTGVRCRIPPEARPSRMIAIFLDIALHVLLTSLWSRSRIRVALLVTQVAVS